MKKFILSIAALAMAGAAFAQTAGQSAMEFGLNWNVTKLTEGSKTVTTEDCFTFTPVYHFFAAENFRLGISLGMTLYGGDKTDGDLTSVFAPGVDFAYYIKIADKFYWIPDLAVSYGFSKYKNTSDIKTGTFAIGADIVSFEFRPCDNFGINFKALTLAWAKSTTTVSGSEDSKTSVSKFNLVGTPTLGFVYYF